MPGRFAERRAQATVVFQFLLDNSLLLVIGAVAGLLWANVDPAGYRAAAVALGFLVNDVGMVFFFALMTKEVFEAMLPGGPLATPKQAAVPIFAAIGGMVAPAALYLITASALDRPDLLRGWAIPCATDIAFAYLAARMVFRPGHPAVPFLLLLAIADDALGLIVLAVFYPAGSVSAVTLAVGLAVAMLFAAVLRARRVRTFWFYLAGPGVIAWLALHEGGLHPALAMVPIVPFMPHAHSDLHLYGERRPTMEAFHRWWQLPVQLILLLFGVVNAGVPLSSVGAPTVLVLLSLVIGKPLGIVVTTFIADRSGFRRAEGLDWPSVTVMGIAAGIGFTVALFFATAAFPDGAVLAEAKMGALLSFVAFPAAVVAGRLLGIRKL